MGFGLGLGLLLGGDLGFSPLGLTGGAGGLDGGAGGLAGGAGGLDGGAGGLAGGAGGLAGGVFGGLLGGFGGGGGTLSAMTILYWQPEVLFERIGHLMSN